MRRFIDCENGDIILHDNEEIFLNLDNIEVSFSETYEVLGIFNLKITNQRLTLLNEDSGYEFDIPFIGLHAISRDINSYPKPCIYCQLDQEEGETPEEMYLSPSDSNQLQSIFDALSKAALLNPDPIEPGYVVIYCLVCYSAVYHYVYTGML